MNVVFFCFPTWFQRLLKLGIFVRANTLWSVRILSLNRLLKRYGRNFKEMKSYYPNIRIAVTFLKILLAGSFFFRTQNDICISENNRQYNFVKGLKLLYFARNVVLCCSLYLTPDMVIQVCLFYVHFDNNTLMLVIFLKLVIVICQVCFAWFFSRLISTNSFLV